MEFTKLECEKKMDPIFTEMTRKFNNSNIQGLLMKVLPLDEGLDFIIEDVVEKDYDYYKEKYNIENFGKENNRKQLNNIKGKIISFIIIFFR